jgi:hypothetical protein
MSKETLTARLREWWAKVDLYSCVMDFGIFSAEDGLDFGEEMSRAIKGEKVRSNIPDRNIILTLINVSV